MADFDEILTRVSIRDILLDAGLEPIGNRMACPIHGGQNKTSFRFDDHTFICYSCGSKGGLLDLVEYLQSVTRTQALEYLCKLAGIDVVEFQRDQGEKDQSSKLRIKWSPAPRRYTDNYYEIENQFAFKKLYRDALDVTLRITRRAMKKGEIPLAEYYAKEQWYLYQLELLDPELIRLNYELNEIKRKGNRNVFCSKSNCCERN